MKVKSNKAASKRFRINSSGKIKRKKAFLRHNMRKRSPGVKRQLRKKGLIAPADVLSINKLLPNG